MAEADVGDDPELLTSDNDQRNISDNRFSCEDDEFGCDDDEDDLTKTFNMACESLKTAVESLAPPQLLEFYGLYKQATVGPCSIPRPGWYAFEAKQKWDAWNLLGNMGKVDAMKAYVQLANQYGTIDKENLSDEYNESKRGGWVAVSSMADGDVHINDQDKTIFDRVKENDLIKIKQLIRGRDVTSKDSDGMGLIHWAADRGSLDIIKFLVDDMNADIEMRDADGQTALHYAASCGHTDVVKFLTEKGANKAAADNEGALPLDVASDKDIESILS